jgi:VanZ family protein
MAATGWPRKLGLILPAILFVGIVAVEGTQRFSIENTADLLAPFWFRHVRNLPYQRYWEFVEAVRKLGHLAGYGLITLVFFVTVHAFFRRRADRSGWTVKNHAAGWALVLTMALGTADEIHQRFVPQRTSTVTDVGFDVCGGYFALMLLFAGLRLRENRLKVTIR